MAVALLSALLCGCASSSKQAADNPTHPVAAVSQAPETTATLDAPSAAQLLFHVKLFVISLPEGSYSTNEDFWKRIDEQCVDPATSDLLYKNGIRVGVAPMSEMEFFYKFINDIAPMQQFSMAGPQMKDVQLEMKTGLQHQTLFHFDRENNAVGRSFDGSDNILSLSFEPAMRKAGQLRMTICPMVKATRRRLQYTQRNGEFEIEEVLPEHLYDLNCRADVPPDHFLIITPSPDARRSYSVGNAFLVKEMPAERREQILLVVPTTYKVDPAKPQAAVAAR